MADKDLMDTETRNEPATVQQGRESPAGSRGETGQKEGIDLSPAIPIEGENMAGTKWECMSCGSVYDDPVEKCPNCGGHIRKAGLQATPVYDQKLHEPSHLSGPPPAPTETPAGTANLGTEDASDSARIEDLTARGETDSAIPQSEDPDERARVQYGGDHRLQAERVHESDRGSPGGGGGVGSD